MLIAGPFDVRQAALQRLALGALPKLVAAPVEPAAPQQAASSLPQPPASVAMLVAMSASDPRARRQRISAAVDKGLRTLETLYAELRVGPPGPSRLGELAAWMGDHDVPEDPAVAGLLREVELRVLVELAKADRGN